jgi:hypothetical protein
MRTLSFNWLFSLTNRISDHPFWIPAKTSPIGLGLAATASGCDHVVHTMILSMFHPPKGFY